VEHVGGGVVEGDEADELDRTVVGADRGDGDLGGGAQRVTEDAGGDRREGDRAGAGLGGDLERSPVRGGEQVGLAGSRQIRRRAR
jgi:hypothetical protein